MALAEPFDTSLDPVDTQVFWSVVDTYTRARRETQPYYRLKVEMHRHPNRIHFVRAADLIREIGADPHEYIAAQFVDTVPYPNGLYSKRAQQRWVDYLIGRDAAGRVAAQDQRFRMYGAHMGEGTTEFDILLNPVCQFDAWYRIFWFLQLNLDAGRDLVRDARNELRSAAFRRAIRDAGYDLDAIDSYIEAHA
ncbi:hypothetical protein LCGC14_0461660 [marine sediment metagenome]|uniref:Uncharacterized protein n=1 Tax=marine sediment metagenome TaxID=412755 RepID=A0A0F9VNS4_9ZZZZ